MKSGGALLKVIDTGTRMGIQEGEGLISCGQRLPEGQKHLESQFSNSSDAEQHSVQSLYVLCKVI